MAFNFSHQLKYSESLWFEYVLNQLNFLAYTKQLFFSEIKRMYFWFFVQQLLISVAFSNFLGEFALFKASSYFVQKTILMTRKVRCSEPKNEMKLIWFCKFCKMELIFNKWLIVHPYERTNKTLVISLHASWLEGCFL